MLRILEKFGVPPGIVNTVQKLYKVITIEFDAAETRISFASTLGVKQGNNLAQTLFLFVIQAAIEHLDSK